MPKIGPPFGLFLFPLYLLRVPGAVFTGFLAVEIFRLSLDSCVIAAVVIYLIPFPILQSICYILSINTAHISNKYLNRRNHHGTNRVQVRRLDGAWPRIRRGQNGVPRLHPQAI